MTFLTCNPKLAYGSDGKQDVTRDGISKWEVQVAVTFVAFGRIENEILKISIASHTDPAAEIDNPQSVKISGLRIRVKQADRREDRPGGERPAVIVTYQADAISPIDS
ncbi:hypothetical protein [Streptomyces sp. NPDC007355]|uniref:hypothetical protein n=1 Tax=Streptomyces sp. NPDC007355 TaxID=3364778 RepID=UPI0036A0D5B7